METIYGIVIEEDVKKAFEGTNFGSAEPRNVIFGTLLKRSCGYHSGYTAEQICIELGLLTEKSNKPTKKGKEYLYRAVTAVMPVR